MNATPPHILLITADEAWAAALDPQLPLAPQRYHLLEEALADLREREADLVILDLALPDTPGLGALLRLLGVRPRVPVVALVPDSDDELAARALRAGCALALQRGRLDPIVLCSLWNQLQAIRHSPECGRPAVDRLAAIPRESPYPILECDSTGQATYVNPATERALAELRIELAEFLPAEHTGLTHACLSIGEPVVGLEVSAGGRIYSWTYQPLPAAQVVHLFGVDITERKRAEQRLQQNALQDELTGLPNRALLADRLARNLELRSRHPDYQFGLVLLDLDRFQVVNESLGHAVGDQLLVEVTARLRACVKQADTLARVGGDEFVILLEDTGSAENALRVVARIEDELRRPFGLAGHELFTSASIGLTVTGPEVRGPEELLRDVETAMVTAKTSGKGQAMLFEPSMRQSSHGRLSLETDLRLALERGELICYYQPIVSVRTGRILACESLIRWRHPQRGLVSPMAFIPLAEETGLIEPIGEFVLRQACLQTRAWQEAGLGRLQVSINLSARQFRRDDLVDSVRHAVEHAGIEPQRLEVEITESVAARDVDFAVATLGRLREMGIQVLIDDFGTGYSSLSYLKRFPVDLLKIDRSFIKDVTSDTGSAAIVTTVILMAHALGFEVVAEGVEKLDQLTFLTRHHCDFAQGFLFSKPVPPEAFADLLRRQAH